MKIPVAILGATGMVGQKFIILLANHPWFEVTTLAASNRSAGKPYIEAVGARWSQAQSIPENLKGKETLSVEDDLDKIKNQAAFVFCAIDADKDYIKKIEESYAAAGLPVVSNNSAHRWTPDVPMLMPEINPEHLSLIDVQRKNRGWQNGFIITKPNCSIQSYVPIIEAWKKFRPVEVVVSTYQAISGAGKTFDTWPEMIDNVIPYIGGEEEKSEREPMKVWGKVENGSIAEASNPKISANCVRVPALDGHLAALNVRLAEQVTSEMLIDKLEKFENPIREYELPSAPKPLIKYMSEPDRPQTGLDRNFQNGMGITVGRLRLDPVLGWKCIALSHNTIRGAAGGSILNAELLVKTGYINS